MIQIGRPYIEQAGKNFRLTADVVMDQETKKWWFEVPAEYKQYLCTERSDAFLIGILPLAMRFGEDISLDAPVTEELLFNDRDRTNPVIGKQQQKFVCKQDIRRDRNRNYQ